MDGANMMLQDTERRWELINKQLLNNEISQEEFQELQKLNENLPKFGIRHIKKSTSIDPEIWNNDRYEKEAL